LISREDVLHVALLSRLELTEAEVEQFTTELNAILGHVEQIQGVDVEGVEPTSHPLGLEDVMRSDERRPSLTHEQILANAPERVSEGFKVPPVIGQGS
jgi:aspartyl-tRNA(Asn)/glutamyl-tRNA(Gln) amidotransferase subunit C